MVTRRFHSPARVGSLETGPFTLDFALVTCVEDQVQATIPKAAIDETRSINRTTTRYHCLGFRPGTSSFLSKSL